MERRRTEVFEMLKNITEEKKNVIVNLDNLTKEVESAVQIVNETNNDELRRSGLLLRLLKFEHKLLPALYEINDILESIAEEQRTSSLSCNSFSFTDVRPAFSRESSVCENIERTRSADVDIVKLKEQMQQFDVKLQHFMEFTSENRNKKSNIPSMQTIQNNLKKSCSNNLVMPSTSGVCSSFEVPEKDNSKKEVHINTEPRIELLIGKTEDHIKLEPGAEPPIGILCDIEGSVDDAPPDKVDVKYVTGSHFINGVKPYSNKQIKNDCVSKNNNGFQMNNEKTVSAFIDLTINGSESDNSPSSESDKDLIEVVNVECSQSSNSSTSNSSTLTAENSLNNSVVYTALRKLNNLKIFDRRKEYLDQFALKDIPDISLKPLLDDNKEPVVSNVVSTESDSLELQKNCNKNNVVEFGQFEIKDSEVPSPGEDCMFSFIRSPNEFYIQIIKDSTVFLETHNQQLEELYAKTKCPFKTKLEAKVILKRFCIVYSDKHQTWNRGEVLDWSLDEEEESNNEVLIRYIDYGDTEIVSFENLRALIEECTYLPRQAIRCHLPYLYPPGSTRYNLLTKWPEATFDALISMTLTTERENDSKLFRIVYVEKSGDSVAIDLYNLMEYNPDSTVGQLLIDLNLAVQITEEFSENDDPSLMAFIGDAEEMGLADDIAEAVQGYSARDEARVCKFWRRGEPCYRGDHCKFEHIDITQEDFTTDTELVYKECFNNIYLPPERSEIMILITEFINLCNFYAQIIQEPHSVNDHTVERKLFNLMEAMNNMETLKQYTTFKILPAIGEIVVVKHWATKKWLRGKVTEIITEDDVDPKTIQVFIVDFGELVNVPLKDIRKMNEAFLHLPFQAIKCYLEDVEQSPDVERNQARKFFEDNMNYRNFKAIALSDGVPLKVSLRTLKGVKISSVLLKLNLVQKKEHDYLPATSSKLLIE